MRKSDNEVVGEKAEVVHFQTRLKFDSWVLLFLALWGCVRLVYGTWVLINQIDYTAYSYFESNPDDRWVHAFLYDFNYGTTTNVIYAMAIILAAYLLHNRRKFGMYLYVFPTIILILYPILDLSETAMYFQSYYWWLSGIWIILILARYRHVI